jgi:FixJ family two-component response regulator
VDDDSVLREALCSLFLLYKFQVYCYASAVDFLDSYDGQQAGCLVADIKMPVMNGLELQAEMISRGIKLPIIFITGAADVEMCIQAYESGAAGFIQKPFECQQLLSLVFESTEQDLKRHTTEIEISDIKDRFARLTPRERDVMMHVAKGESSKVIAAQLGMSPRTVEVHRARIYEKVRSKSVVDLVYMAAACGYVEPLDMSANQDV